MLDKNPNNYSFLFLKDFGQAKLLLDNTGQTWVFWTLTQKQQDLLGSKISAFLCFKNYDLCEQHLRRPHLTCLTCKLRRVIIGKLLPSYPINISQIWLSCDSSTFRKLLQKNLLSLAEFLT
jgi:hypothetical protein